MTSVRLVGNVEGIRQAAAKLQRAAQTRAIPDAILTAARQEVRPLQQAASRRALGTLPSWGGLADEVSRQPMPITTSLSGQVSVRIDVRPGRGKSGVGDPAAINRGRLRHPVFGHRDRWVTQRVPAGWFTIPMAQGAGRIREALAAALRREIEKLK